MFRSCLNLTNLTSMIKELAYSQSVEDPHVSLICKSNDFGISDGRASAFAKRDDQHVSFSNRYSNRFAHSVGPGVMGSSSLGINMTFLDF